jgi:hypothetical protein
MSSASLTLGSTPVRSKASPASGIHRRTPAKPYVLRSQVRAERLAVAARFLMLAATALYLSIELPFAARLVELLSTRATAADVEDVERLGRFVSGAALALAAWGHFLPRWIAARRSPATIALRLALLTAACIALMMVGQRTLVDSISDAASADRRRAALHGVIARDVAGSLAGADGSRQAAVGSIPFLSLMASDAASKPALRETDVRAYGDRAFPGLLAYRNDVARPVLAKVQDAFRDYRDASAKIETGRRKAYPELERAWVELQDTIARRRLNVEDPKVRREIANQLHTKSIFVPYKFHPYDRPAFFQAGIEGAVGKAERTLKSKLQQAFGADVALGLPTLDAFAAQPAVQDSLKKSLGLAVGGPAIRLSATADALAERHHPEARKQFSERLSRALAGKGSLSPDLDGNGRDAVRLALAAAFGIVLSALGAAVHICKLAYYAGSIASPRIAVAAAGIAAALVLALPLSHGAPAPMPAPLAWSAGAHGLLSPVGHALGASPALQATTSLVHALPAR